MDKKLDFKRSLFQTAFLVLLISGCGIFNSETNDSNHTVQFDLIIDKAELAPGEQFTAIYSATNLTNKTIELRTSCIGFAITGVYKNGENMRFNGTSDGCRPALNSFEIGPYKSLKFEWNIDAFILSREVGQLYYDTSLVAPGNYKLRVTTNVAGINDKGVFVKPKEINFKVN